MIKDILMVDYLPSLMDVGLINSNERESKVFYNSRILLSV
jgi:hypothetical protein